MSNISNNIDFDALLVLFSVRCQIYYPNKPFDDKNVPLSPIMG